MSEYVKAALVVIGFAIGFVVGLEIRNSALMWTEANNVNVYKKESQ